MTMITKRFVIGDIHGRYEALKQCLDRSNFNYDKDRLIVLGDIVDGGYNTYQVVEELLKIKNLIFVLGNHDEWFLDHMSSGWTESIWVHQGGANTLRSYGATGHDIDINTANINIPNTHQEFFNSAKFYHIEDDMLFVHGGYEQNQPMHLQSKHILLWDRRLANNPETYHGIYKKVFIGHSTTQLKHNTMEPVIKNSVYLMDCGAGWNGKLAIMNIDTEEYWLSDIQTPALDIIERDSLP